MKSSDLEEWKHHTPYTAPLMNSELQVHVSHIPETEHSMWIVIFMRNFSLFYTLFHHIESVIFAMSFTLFIDYLCKDTQICIFPFTRCALFVSGWNWKEQWYWLFQPFSTHRTKLYSLYVIVSSIGTAQPRYNQSMFAEIQNDSSITMTYDDGHWSLPYFDCGGGNIWMMTFTVPFFGYNNGTFKFKYVFHFVSSNKQIELS